MKDILVRGTSKFPLVAVESILWMRNKEDKCDWNKKKVEGDGERRMMRGNTRGREGQICRTSAFLLMIPKSNRKQPKDFNQRYDMILFAF